MPAHVPSIEPVRDLFDALKPPIRTYVYFWLLEFRPAQAPVTNYILAFCTKRSPNQLKCGTPFQRRAALYMQTLGPLLVDIRSHQFRQDFGTWTYYAIRIPSLPEP